MANYAGVAYKTTTMRSISPHWTRGLFIAGFCGAVVAVCTVFELVTSSPGPAGAARIVASFGCLGFLLGSIYAFDSASDLVVTNMPRVRIILAALAALVLSRLWHFHASATVSWCLVFALLGYLGMTWAKYVDF